MPLLRDESRQCDLRSCQQPAHSCDRRTVRDQNLHCLQSNVKSVSTTLWKNCLSASFSPYIGNVAVSIFCLQELLLPWAAAERPLCRAACPEEKPIWCQLSSQSTVCSLLQPEMFARLLCWQLENPSVFHDPFQTPRKKPGSHPFTFLAQHPCTGDSVLARPLHMFRNPSVFEVQQSSHPSSSVHRVWISESSHGSHHPAALPCETHSLHPDPRWGPHNHRHLFQFTHWTVVPAPSDFASSAHYSCDNPIILMTISVSDDVILHFIRDISIYMSHHTDRRQLSLAWRHIGGNRWWLGWLPRGQDSGSGCEKETGVLSAENSIFVFIRRLGETRDKRSTMVNEYDLAILENYLPGSQPSVVLSRL